jgi:PEP-CTERM motif
MCPSRKPPRTAEKTEHGHIRAVALKFSLVISEVRRSDMTTRLWTRFALAFLVLVASAHTTGAATITYSYAGSCTAGCGEVGLDVGDSVSGFIAFRDSELIPGNPYPDPVSFSFVFGGVQLNDTMDVERGLFDYPPPPFPGLPLPAIVPLDLTSFLAQLNIGGSGAAPVPVLAILPDGRWFGTLDGACGGLNCSFVLTRGTFAEGVGAWSTSTATVPEPTTVTLITTGLMGLASFLRRRRGRSSTGIRLHRAPDNRTTEESPFREESSRCVRS